MYCHRCTRHRMAGETEGIVIIDQRKSGRERPFAGEATALEPLHLDRHDRNEQARRRRQDD
jgi:hypothetical protein